MMSGTPSLGGRGGHTVLVGRRKLVVRSARILVVAAMCTASLASLGGCAARSQEPGAAAAREPLRDTHGIAHRVHQVAGLKVVEVVVGDVPFDSDLPIVMQIHGRGDHVRIPSAPRQREQPVRLLLPEAPDRYRSGFSWSPVSVTEGRTRELSRALRLQSSRLVHVLRYFKSLRPSRGEPVITGFSQGGMLSFALAVLYPEDVGTSLPVAGWLPPQLTPRRIDDASLYPSIHALHATNDPVVRVGPTRRSVRRLQQLGLDADLAEIVATGHMWTPELREAHRSLMRDAVTHSMRSMSTTPDAPPPPAAPGT
jgi:phospholipase/carboxylesterase